MAVIRDIAITELSAGQVDQQAKTGNATALEKLLNGHGVGREAICDHKAIKGQIVDNDVREALATIKASRLHLEIMEGVRDYIQTAFDAGTDQWRIDATAGANIHKH